MREGSTRLAFRFHRLVVAVVFCVSALSVHQTVAAQDGSYAQPVTPLAEQVSLQIDPADKGYSGKVDITLQFTGSTNVVVFDAQNLPIQSTTINGIPGELKVIDGGHMAARFGEPIPSGRNHLQIAFTNLFGANGKGIFKVGYGSNAVVYTRFFPASARTAFPCWDGPETKIPWTLSLSVPEGLSAFANMPMVRTNQSGTNIVHEFAPTPPMTAQLLAFAVGHLSALPVPGLSIPGRVIVQPGDEAKATRLVEATPRILAALERYFGSPYPFPKLDACVVPIDVSMEDGGLIMYGRTSILVGAEVITPSYVAVLHSVAAHEISHMWLGNVVTMASWRDFWFHESFASFLETKETGELFPTEWMNMESPSSGARKEDVSRTVRAMGDTPDAEAASSSQLVYQKGEAVLKMVEAYFGEEVFQTATRNFVESYRWKLAKSADLYRLFNEAGPMSGSVLQSFVDLPGIPKVTARIVGTDTIELSQSRYSTMGNKVSTAGLWKIPITIKYGDGTTNKEAKVLLGDAVQTVSLPGISQSNSWMMPNGHASGYYNWSVPRSLLTNLWSHLNELSVPERLDTLESAKYAVLSGEMEGEEWLSLLLASAQDDSVPVGIKVIEGLIDFRRIYLREEVGVEFQELVSKSLTPLLLKIGWEPRADEPANVDTLRCSLVEALGILGQDKMVIDYCRKKAAEELKAPPEQWKPLEYYMMDVATRWGDRVWKEALSSAAEHAKSPTIKSRYTTELGRFHDPDLIREVLGDGLSGKIPLSDLTLIVFGLSDRVDSSGILAEWLIANFDVLRTKMSDSVDYFPQLLERTDTQSVERLRQLFRSSNYTSPDLEKNFSQVDETLALGSALREKGEHDLRQWLLKGRSQ